MTLYYDSLASGGSGNGDCTNSNNFWEDTSRTIPHNATPTSSDDLVLYDIILTGTGTMSCANLSDSGSHAISGGNIAAFGNLTSISISGGLLSFSGTATSCSFSGGTVAGSSPTIASACTFQVDIGPVHSSSSCSFFNSYTSAITDDGTGTFDSGHLYATITYNGTWSQAAGVANMTATAINGGNFTGGTVNCNNITGGTFTNTTVNQTGSSVTLSIPSLGSGCSVSWSGVTGFTGISCTGVSISGSTLTFSGLAGTASSGSVTLDFPDASNVLLGSSSNHVNGSAILPIAGDVRSGTVYGVGPSGNRTGTLSAGGGTRAFTG